MIAGLDRHDRSSAGFQPAFNNIAGKMPALRLRQREAAAQDVVCRYETTAPRFSGGRFSQSRMIFSVAVLTVRRQWLGKGFNPRILRFPTQWKLRRRS